MAVKEILQLGHPDLYLTCDPANNYLMLQGWLQKEKADLLAAADEFLAQPEDIRQRHYASIGSVI